MIAAIVLVMTTALAQASQGQVQIAPRTPPRDATQPNVKGTAVLRGRVTNTDGRPLRRVQLRLSGDVIPEGRTASTNGLGRFEIAELPAGRFSLNASRAGYLQMSYGQSRPGEPGRPIELADAQTVENVDIVLPRTALISGRIVDEAGEPLAGATVMPLQMRFFNGKRRLLPVRGMVNSDDTGQYRISGLEPGEYYVQASSRETWETDPPDKQSMGFLPTFYPSSPNSGEAQRVRIKMGQEVVGIDVNLLPGKTSKISGTAFNSQGAPLAGENVSMSFEIRGENFMGMFGGQTTKVNPDGSFVFRNIAPGEYHLNVRTAATPDRPAEGTNVIVSALGSDVEGVSLVTTAAGTIVGRIVVEQGAKLSVPLTRLTVRAQPVDRDTAINPGGIPDNGRVRDDGSYELKSVFGSNRLSIGPLPDGWAIRGIDHNGRDLTSAPVDPQGQTLDGAIITLTDRFPALSGTLRDAKGNAEANATVILFPDDASTWIEDLRTVRTARVDQSGLFSIKAIRPGEYLAVAVPHVTGSQWNDPEYLESLRERATRITLAEGKAQQIDLTIR
jgi:protocatechuate 3,4-dioxygenase beta subunit